MLKIPLSKTLCIFVILTALMFLSASGRPAFEGPHDVITDAWDGREFGAKSRK
jgi:hypothetical protein